MILKNESRLLVLCITKLSQVKIMSCNGINLYSICGIGGNGNCYSGRSGGTHESDRCTELYADNCYHPNEMPLPAYSHCAEIEFWKPGKTYADSAKIPSAKEFGFAYNPMLDLMLSYLAYRQKEQHCLKQASGNKEMRGISLNEQQELEKLIADEKRRMVVQRERHNHNG